VIQAQLVQPGDEPVQAVLGDGQFGERAAEHRRDPVVLVPSQLGLEVAGGDGGAPAELDNVDVVARDLDQPVDVGHAQTAVEHVRDALLAGLGGARGKLEQILHGGHRTQEGSGGRRGATAGRRAAR
jgi:hypothetical protein